MLSKKFPALSAKNIRLFLDDDTNEKLSNIAIHSSVSSTNDELWTHISEGGQAPVVCISESQTAGRGRRGDQWHSPASGNLYLSLSWSFPAETAQNGLSIAIGVGLINALKSEGINNLQLKWPNDVLYKRQKLAGILVESRFGKQLNTVVGIGLNFKLPTATINKIQQPTTSLQQLCTIVPCRNKLAGKIIQNMINTLEQFQQHGLRDFLAQFSDYDALKDQAITLISDKDKRNVIARGINDQGELQYQFNDALLILSNSHTSIRFSS